MKRRLFSILFALPVMSALAGVSNGPVIKTSNLEQQIGELAEWSQPHAVPGEYRAIYKVSFCQKRKWGAPKEGEPPCRSILYARGASSSSGFVQIDAAPSSVLPRSSGDWYPLSAEWRNRLWMKVRRLGSPMNGQYVYRTADADGQVEGLADWSQEIKAPMSGGDYGLLFCQQPKESPDAVEVVTESCHVLRVRRGNSPGAVALIEGRAATDYTGALTWHRLSPIWDKTILGWIKNREGELWGTAATSTTSSTTEYYPAYRGCWYTDPFGNQTVVQCE